MSFPRGRCTSARGRGRAAHRLSRERPTSARAPPSPSCARARIVEPDRRARPVGARNARRGSRARRGGASIPATTTPGERAATSLLEPSRRAKGSQKSEADAILAHSAHLRRRARRTGARPMAAWPAPSHTTADVLRAALWLIGPAAGVHTVSSAFYMVSAVPRYDVDEVLTFTDCAVVPYPTATQLADIAIAAAARPAAHRRRRAAASRFFRSARGAARRVESVDLVREALAEVQARARLRLAVDGELQGDAALVAAVAAPEGSGQPGGGRANVLVFPVARCRQHRVQAGAAIGCARARSGRSCRDCGDRAAISRAARSWRTYSTWPPSPRSSRRERARRH